MFLRWTCANSFIQLNSLNWLFDSCSRNPGCKTISRFYTATGVNDLLFLDVLHASTLKLVVLSPNLTYSEWLSCPIFLFKNAQHFTLRMCWQKTYWKETFYILFAWAWHAILKRLGHKECLTQLERLWKDALRISKRHVPLIENQNYSSKSADLDSFGFFEKSRRGRDSVLSYCQMMLSFDPLLH